MDTVPKGSTPTTWWQQPPHIYLCIFCFLSCFLHLNEFVYFCIIFFLLIVNVFVCCFVCLFCFISIYSISFYYYYSLDLSILFTILCILTYYHLLLLMLMMMVMMMMMMMMMFPPFFPNFWYLRSFAMRQVGCHQTWHLGETRKTIEISRDLPGECDGIRAQYVKIYIYTYIHIICIYIYISSKWHCISILFIYSQNLNKTNQKRQDHCKMAESRQDELFVQPYGIWSPFNLGTWSWK